MVRYLRLKSYVVDPVRFRWDEMSWDECCIPPMHMYCSYFEHCDICKHLLNCIFTYSITLHFTALWILSGTTRVSQYEKKHSPTHTYRPLSASSIYYNPRHPPCSIYVSDSLLPQSLSKFSVVYPLGVGSVSSGTGSPGCPGQNPESRKTVVCVCMCVLVY